MVQTVAQFFTTVRNAVARGASLDGSFPAALRTALRAVEDNYNLRYMRRMNTYSVAKGDTTLTIYGDVATTLKTIRDLYYFDSAGFRKPLAQINPEQQLTNTGDYPVGFIMTQVQQIDGTVQVTLTFDAPFDAARTLTMHSFNYTGWTGDTGAANLWLVNNAETLMLAGCMTYLAPIMRDTTLMQMYGAMYQKALGELLKAQDDLERGADGYE
jgi:hypothetical protein